MDNIAASIAQRRILAAKIKADYQANSDKAIEYLHEGNDIAYNAYIERAIALEDILTWVKEKQR